MNQANVWFSRRHDLLKMLVDVARVDASGREVVAREDAFQERDVRLHPFDTVPTSASRIVWMAASRSSPQAITLAIIGS